MLEFNCRYRLTTATELRFAIIGFGLPPSIVSILDCIGFGMPRYSL